MLKPGDNIHIPLTERETLAGLLKVKPTADMPEPHAMNAKPKRKDSKTKSYPEVKGLNGSIIAQCGEIAISAPQCRRKILRGRSGSSGIYSQLSASMGTLLSDGVASAGSRMKFHWHSLRTLGVRQLL